MATVLQVAYPFAPVSTDAVGGAEQILAAIDAALTARGHRSLVVACAGSRVTGTLFEVPSVEGLIDDRTRRTTHAHVRTAIARALASAHVDVVHLHGLDFDAYAPSDVPLIVTLHLPVSWYAPAAFATSATFVCVSEAQRRTCPVTALTVENSVDLRAFRARCQPGSYALAVGRICPEKGFEHAIAACDTAGVPLVLAGHAFGCEAHLRYFEMVLAPRLRDPNRRPHHRWIGPIGDARKRRLLAGARCLLVPSRVAETNSLVAMEALASGTPAIAHPVGTLTDLVEHGRTGWLAGTVDDMAAAIRRTGELSRAACRATAEARFSGERMIDQYLALYDVRATRSRVSVAIVDSPEELAALGPEWTDLWTRVPAATLFQRPEWLVPWSRHLRHDRLHVVAVRDGRRLVALLPFVVGPFGVALAGGGVSDYLDVLVDPAAESMVGPLLSRVLAELDHRCVAADLPQRSPLLRWSIDCAGPVERDGVCPVWSWSGDRPPMEALPAGFARRLAYARRRAAREGFRFEEVRASTLQPFLDALFELHAARWQVRGEAGVLADPCVERFHREAAEGLLAAGLLAMHGLRDPGGRLVAVTYGFLSRRRGALYVSGFDPAFAARSPGMLTIGRTIESAHAAGARAFDFLRGTEAYKYDWGARDEWTMRRVLRAGPEEERLENVSAS
jgi:CelD/BcsL family acetyltransferase involved in cellulose biosynthesis